VDWQDQFASRDVCDLVTIRRCRISENGAAMLDSTRDFFDTLAKVLIRCWFLGTALLLFSFVVFMLTGEIIDYIHGRWFGLTPHELDLIIYCGLALHKLFLNLFFLFPWIAIRLVLRKANG
jgi:hypothetical protein